MPREIALDDELNAITEIATALAARILALEDRFDEFGATVLPNALLPATTTASRVSDDLASCADKVRGQELELRLLAARVQDLEKENQ